jgi:hypothetical protein
VAVWLREHALALDPEQAEQAPRLLDREGVRLLGGRLTLDVDVQDQRAARPQHSHRLAQHRARITHVVERVARDHHVDRLAQQRKRLGAAGQVHGIALQ